MLAQRAGQVRATGHVVEVLRLHFLLIGLPMVEVIEVGDDYRNWKGDGEDTRNCAEGPHYLAPHSYRPNGQRKIEMKLSVLLKHLHRCLVHPLQIGS